MVLGYGGQEERRKGSSLLWSLPKGHSATQSETVQEISQLKQPLFFILDDTQNITTVTQTRYRMSAYYMPNA